MIRQVNEEKYKKYGFNKRFEEKLHFIFKEAIRKQWLLVQEMINFSYAHDNDKVAITAASQMIQISAREAMYEYIRRATKQECLNFFDIMDESCFEDTEDILYRN